MPVIERENMSCKLMQPFGYCHWALGRNSRTKNIWAPTFHMYGKTKGPICTGGPVGIPVGQGQRDAQAPGGGENMGARHWRRELLAAASFEKSGPRKVLGQSGPLPIFSPGSAPICSTKYPTTVPIHVPNWLLVWPPMCQPVCLPFCLFSPPTILSAHLRSILVAWLFEYFHLPIRLSAYLPFGFYFSI